MKTYRLNDLKDSKILYDKNPPKFILYIFLIVLVSIILIITYTNFTYKTEVVRTSGILSAENKSNIQSPVGGKITNIYKENGEYVSKGDILFELDNIDTYASIVMLEAKEVLMQRYVSNYNQMINILVEFDVNDISNINNPFEEEFYYMFKQFNEMLQTAKEDTDNNISLMTARQNVIEQYLSQYYQSRFQYEYELIGIKSQIEAYEQILDKYKVYATENGYISYNSSIQIGMVIDSTIIGSISEEITVDNSIIECYVDVSNRSFISAGMEVEIVIYGMSQSKYGTIIGELIDISKDIILNEDGNAFYKVDIKPESIYLVNNKNEIQLVSGQVGEVRIKYETMTWFSWAMKKIGIIDR